MKLTPRDCPECGQEARGIVERVAGCARLFHDDDGCSEYAGETEIWWDEQRADEDTDGRVTLICDVPHEWQAAIVA